MCFQGVFVLNKESLYSLRKLLGRKLNLVLVLFRLTLTLGALLPPPGLGEGRFHLQKIAFLAHSDLQPARGAALCSHCRGERAGRAHLPPALTPG